MTQRLTAATLFAAALLVIGNRAHGQTDVVDAGRTAFGRVCQRCHGAEARGDAGPRLVPFSREYDELLGIVREGAGQMPPIATRELSDDNVAQILAYLKSLSP